MIKDKLTDMRKAIILFVAGFILAAAAAGHAAWRMHLWAEAAAESLEEQYRLNDSLSSDLRWSEWRLKLCTSLSRDMDGLRDAVFDTALVPYANPGATCYDHSQLLTGRLRSEGILSFIAVTDGPGDLGRHAYVLVAVEPTPGLPGSCGVVRGDDMSPYLPVREIRDHGLNVVCN